MQRLQRWRQATGSALALGWLVAAPASAQQSITGRLTDHTTGMGIVSARISVEGTNAATLSRSDGRYSLALPGTGTVLVRASAVGYASQIRSVTLGATAPVDFQLESSVVQLDEIVTTATGDQPRLELGTTVGVIRADSVVANSAISNLTDVLNSRVAGVTVQTQTGTVGGGSRIRIRGANSLSLSNEPILLVDGVRVDNNPFARSIDVGGQAPSRINDLSPNDIESIEVIKGPSAATLYGVEAANGVIAIKTKRGHAGRTTWGVHTEAGVDQDKNPYPDNYDAFGVQDGEQSTGCLLFLVALGACEAQDSVVRFNPLRNPRTSPLTSGLRTQIGANVSGGTEQLRFYLGADLENIHGTYLMPGLEQDSVRVARGISAIPGDQLRPNTSRRASFRSSVTARVTDNVEIDATIGYVQHRVRLPQNDNNLFGIVLNALGGSASNPNGRWFFMNPAASFADVNTQLTDRITGSVSAQWRPSPSVSARLLVGLDRNAMTDSEEGRAGEGPQFGRFLIGTRTSNKFSIGVYSVDGALTAHRSLNGSLRSTTTVGGQFYRTTVDGTLATGNGIAAGSNSIEGALQQIASSQHTSVTSGGLFLEEKLTWKEKLFVTGAIRLDQASAFARTQGAIVLPKAAISYIAITRPEGWLNLLRVRAAYGQSLVAPGALVALRTYHPVVGVSEIGTEAAVTFGNLGNEGLKPERSREFEAGVDASFLRDRLSVELTFYDKLTRDALVDRPLAPSLGVSAAQFYNVGSMRNRGLELGVIAEVLNGKTIAADIAFVGALLHNRLLSLGPDVEPYGDFQRYVPGYPAGGHWGLPLGYDDADKDGVITPDEITVGDTVVFLGPVLPTREFTLVPTVSLWNGWVRIGSQWNYRGGNVLLNATDLVRCAIATCRALYDPTAPLTDQARAVANVTTGGEGSAGDFQSADFLRLRELSITLSAPRSILRLLGASRANLTLAGRNVAVWTKYRGIDPETSAVGAANYDTFDFMTLPPLRTWIVRVNLGF